VFDGPGTEGESLLADVEGMLEDEIEETRIEVALLF